MTYIECSNIAKENAQFITQVCEYHGIETTIQTHEKRECKFFMNCRMQIAVPGAMYLKTEQNVMQMTQKSKIKKSTKKKINHNF